MFNICNQGKNLSKKLHLTGLEIKKSSGSQMQKILVPSLNNVNDTAHSMVPSMTFVGTFFHDEGKAR